MNPLTQVKNVQKITAREAAAGVSEDASWHAKYKESAYVFIGGLQYDLTEGDLLAVFAQYGEIVDVNLVRDKATGKSKGFAFLAYQDQRSTTLAVDNLNGATIVGRTVRVDHVANYKRKKEEDEEEEQRKREERGVCYAFQKGECHRGAACKFSHDEQRNANTGWGGKDGDPRWEHDRYEGASQRQHYKKPKYERRSRDDSQDGDDRSGLAGRSVQRSEGSQDRHIATIHEEASTKDVGRWLKYDERRENRNRLKDEKDSFTQPINAENHYMDGEPNRKRDRNQRCFDLGSRNAGKSEDRQDRHIATRHKEANTKDDDGRWSKYDERRGQNRLKDEKDGFTGPIDAEKHYVDAAPSRKRDNERGFDSGSKDAGKSGQKSGSEDRQDRHIATRHEEADTKGDGRWSKYDERRGGQSRLKDEKDGFMKPKYAENRYMDTAPSRTRDRDKRGFDPGPTCANEKGGDDRSRDHSRRDYDRSEKDEDKRSRDHSTAEYDRNVRDNDRREAKYHRR